MLEALCGAATLAYLAVSGLVGIRLVRQACRTQRPARRSLPELRLGLFFVFYGLLASSLEIVAYAGWSSPELALPDAAVRVCHGAFFWLSAVGIAALAAFTRQTFRPREPWAAVVAGAISVSMFATALGSGLTEGYAVRVLNGAFYWAQFATRVSMFAWIAAESFGTWGTLRRRLALGLAEPLVVDRFRLIGVWAISIAVLSNADPMARVVYFLQTGSTSEWIPAEGRPILLASMAVATGLLALAGGCLLQAFFPTAGYRRRVRTRAAS